MLKLVSTALEGKVPSIDQAVEPIEIAVTMLGNKEAIHEEAVKSECATASLHEEQKTVKKKEAFSAEPGEAETGQTAPDLKRKPEENIDEWSYLLSKKQRGNEEPEFAEQG